MVNNKNRAKGGKDKGKVYRLPNKEHIDRELIFKVKGQEYGLITQLFGCRRAEAICSDGVKRIVMLRPTLKLRGIWIGVGDIVLVRCRDFQALIGDVIGRYTYNEVGLLKIYGELPELRDDEFNSNHEANIDENIVGFYE